METIISSCHRIEDMERKGTKVNFLYNMVYQVALMILPLITMPYVSRVLGAEGIGTYSYTYSIAQYFLLFGMLGVENYGNRSIARVRDDEQKRSAVFSSIYTLQFIIASISVIVYVLYIAMFSGNKLYAFLQVFYVLSGAGQKPSGLPQPPFGGSHPQGGRVVRGGCQPQHRLYLSQRKARPRCLHGSPAGCKRHPDRLLREA